MLMLEKKKGIYNKKTNQIEKNKLKQGKGDERNNKDKNKKNSMHLKQKSKLEILTNPNC